MFVFYSRQLVIYIQYILILSKLMMTLSMWVITHKASSSHLLDCLLLKNKVLSQRSRSSCLSSVVGKLVLIVSLPKLLMTLSIHRVSYNARRRSHLLLKIRICPQGHGQTTIGRNLNGTDTFHSILCVCVKSFISINSLFRVLSLTISRSCLVSGCHKSFSGWIHNQ